MVLQGTFWGRGVPGDRGFVEGICKGGGEYRRGWAMSLGSKISLLTSLQSDIILLNFNFFLYITRQSYSRHILYNRTVV